MPRVITWKRTLVGGNSAANPTYVWSKVFKAFERIEAYKDVVFQQRTSGGTDITIVCVKYNIGANVLMWRNGNNIYVPSMVNWGSWYDAMVGAMTHEIGHRYSNNNGHNGIDAGLMRPSMIDPAQNFTPGDFRHWFLLPAKPGAPQPWNEPNRWRGMSAVSKGPTLTEMGYKLNCSGLSVYRRMLHMFEKQEVSPVEE